MFKDPLSITPQKLGQVIVVEDTEDKSKMHMHDLDNKLPSIYGT